MNVFYTPSAAHFSHLIKGEPGICSFNEFLDGELYVEVKSKVENNTVWVIAGTFSPAYNILQLLFLLDALQRLKARINLLITYFGYARQDRAMQGESLHVQVIANCLNNFSIAQCLVIHSHSVRLHHYLTFKNSIPLDFFCAIAQHFDTIVASDEGAYDLTQMISSTLGKEHAFVRKKRSRNEELQVISVTGQIKGKRVLLVDDMVSTGSTLINVANKLEQLGAHSISAAATHGIFAGSAIEQLESSPIEMIYVTNTIKNTYNSNKVKVTNIGPLLSAIINQKH